MDISFLSSSLFTRVSPEHTWLEEHKTRGHQTVAGLREEGSCRSFLLGLSVHTPACRFQSPCPMSRAAPPQGALCTRHSSNRICRLVRSSSRTPFLQSRAWLWAGQSGHTQLPWGSVSINGTGHIPHGDPALSGRLCCRDRTGTWDQPHVGRSRGGQLPGAGGLAA